MMTELVSVSFLWVLGPRRSLIFQHLGSAINHKHQEVLYMGKGKREKMGRNPASKVSRSFLSDGYEVVGSLVCRAQLQISLLP